MWPNVHNKKKKKKKRRKKVSTGETQYNEGPWDQAILFVISDILLYQ